MPPPMRAYAFIADATPYDAATDAIDATLPQSDDALHAAFAAL